MKRKVTLQNKHQGYQKQLLNCLLVSFASTSLGEFFKNKT